MNLGLLDDDLEFAEMAAEQIDAETLVTNEPEQAYEWIREDRIDGLLTDLYLNGITGLDVLEQTQQIRPEFPVILMTGYGSIDTAVEAMKKGAWDYLEKPLDHDRVDVVIERIRDHLEQQQQIKAYRRESTTDQRLIGSSPVMEELRNQIQQIAQEPVNTIITGETGTGKELIAKTLHKQSPRSDSPYITLNSATLPSQHLEAELFGYIKGAFDGAEETREGRLKLADGGTLLLDDLDSLDPELQPKLLQAIEHGEVTKLGADHPRRIDVRFLATTGPDPEELIDQGRLREELYYRLKVGRIEAPPLRDHREDIPELVDYFCSRLDQPDRQFTPEALELLNQYNWPGNVRELRNLVERVLLLHDEPEITPEQLPTEVTSPGQTPGDLDPSDWKQFGSDLPSAMEAIERTVIEQCLEQTNGNQSEAARRLGISRQSLHYKLNQWEHSPDEA